MGGSSSIKEKMIRQVFRQMKSSRCFSTLPSAVQSSRYLDEARKNMILENMEEKDLLSTEKFYDALRRVASKEIELDANKVNLMPYDTQFHREIYSHLISCTSLLKKNVYANTRGESSMTVVGSKGIGKSTTLRTFVEIVGTVIPNIESVYVTFAGYNQGKHPLGTMDVGDVCAQVLGVEPEKSVFGGHIPTVDAIVNYLKKHDRYLFLVVDELDQLYLQRKDCEEKKVLQSTLGQLCSIGDREEGRVIAAVCGSSAALPQLITRSAVANEQMRNLFPFVSVSPDLNGDKFHALRFHVSPCNDFHAVESILNARGCMDPPSITNLVSFFGGSNARQIGKVIIGIQSFKEGKEFVQSLFPFNDNPFAENTWEEYGDLVILIYRALYVKNKTLFDLEPRDADWKTLMPIEEKTVRECHAEFRKARKGGNYINDIQFLQDRSWIVRKDKTLYPCFPSHVKVVCSNVYVSEKTLRETIEGWFKSFLVNININFNVKVL